MKTAVWRQRERAERNSPLFMAGSLFIAGAALLAGAVAHAEEPAAAAAAVPENRVHVVFFPESERLRIREEIRQDVMETMRRENWAAPGSAPAASPETLPEWVKKIRFTGDLTLRAQGDFLDDSNDPSLNFQAINAGAPVDIFLPSTGTPQKVLTIPYLNTTENRNALKVRARLALESNMTDAVDAGLRFATGSSTNPVSTTQTLGHDFNKAAFLLDRAWVRGRTRNELAVMSFTGGRMPNPWQSPTDLVWDRDLGFDGLAMQIKPAVAGSIRTYANLGAFSVANTDAHYPSLSPFKSESRDKWLLGMQFGLSTKMSGGLLLRGAASLYDFENIDGELSSACYAPTDKIPCSTDNRRPGYSQKGNTMFALRLLNRPNPATDPEFQYFGLASPFRVAGINLGFDKPLFGNVIAQFDVEMAKNLAFDQAATVARSPVNNFAPCPASNPNCAAVWEGGDEAWQVQLRVGYAKIVEAGTWEALIGYRYVESDAVLDGFTDSDFHLGGTNAKGIYIGGTLGLAHNTTLAMKYLSASEISGWRYSVDVLQLDLGVRF